jgi:alkyldihydroxyacetonephosphate synthase
MVDPAHLGPVVRETLGFGAQEPEAPARLEDVCLPAPRLATPWPAGTRDRIVHAKGAAYRDIVRAFRGQVDHPPDAVARPRSEAEVEDVLAWAGGANCAVVPYGGGSSVVGGVELRDLGSFDGVISLDLTALDRVLEVDGISRAARIQAGAAGPGLEAQLRPHGLSMRFFPQSFECSTLGGWIATRAGGHFASLWTHVDDLVESVRAITPVGTWASRRLPASGAGVSPDRMLLGSEGTLGVITEAWVRVQPRPRHRVGAAVRFATFLGGAEAVRAIVQARLHPANCRLIDALEAATPGAGPADAEGALLVLGFEAVDEDPRPVDAALRRALELCRAHGGTADPGPAAGSGGADAAARWRDAFMALPYLRDALIPWGVLSETFETAITWDRFPAFHAQVLGATRAALGEPCRVTCRLTHVYPDGPAPYYTVTAPAPRGDEVARWDAVKRAASAAILAGGGTITHHHAVGRDHRPSYDRQRPDPFAAALAGARAAVDPRGLLNPGVLL